MQPHSSIDLQQYRYTVFFDSKLTVTESHVQVALDAMWENNQRIAMCKHRALPGPNVSVWDEFRISLFQERYRNQKESMEKYITNNLYKKLQGDDDDVGDRRENLFKERKDVHLRGGFIVREMYHYSNGGGIVVNEDVLKFGEDWYQDTLSCCIEDQITLFFAHQLHESLIYPLPETWFQVSALK